MPSVICGSPCVRGKLADFEFRRQVSIAVILPTPGTGTKSILEPDGGQRREQVAYDEQRTRTRTRQAKGYRVLRYWNDDVLTHMEDVSEDIPRMLAPASNNGTPSRLSPALRAREGGNSRGNQA